MQSAWQAILSNSGGTWSGETLEGFGDVARERDTALAGTVVSPLVDLAVIRASGADAETFLQGQFTNDLRKLREGHSELAGYCTPKGRMLAIFRIVRSSDGFFLLLPAEIAVAVLKRLRMFVMRSKVVLEDASAELLALGLSGDTDFSASDELSLPTEPDAGVRLGEAYAVRLPSSRPRYLLIASPAEMENCWRRFIAHARPVAPPVWRLLDIRDALPQVFAGTQEAFVPQMVNLDLVNGLSFSKGCYPGQEIVARMHFLGTLKRRMYRFRIAAIAAPAPGTEVRDADETLVGQVIMSAAAQDGAAEGLAVLQIDRAFADGLRIGGESIEVTSPPYPLALATP